jgi:hypothetical protein
MRQELRERCGLRGRFSGTFRRFGKKTGYKGVPVQTALLVDIRDAAGQPLSDHLWFTVGKRIASLALSPGDVVVFEARVIAYTKGYQGRRAEEEWEWEAHPVQRDYRLAFPTKMRKACLAHPVQLPLFSPPFEPRTKGEGKSGLPTALGTHPGHTA